jgi:hypothetical protein
MDITNVRIILQAKHIKEKKNHSICSESLILFKLLTKVNLLKKRKIPFAMLFIIYIRLRERIRAISSSNLHP